MDQTPRFGTHVIRGLTDKFYHHSVKVYNLHVFRDSAAAAHTEARTQRERERERRDSDTMFQTMPQRMDTHTHTHTRSYVKIPVLESILVNPVGYVLS